MAETSGTVQPPKVDQNGNPIAPTDPGTGPNDVTGNGPPGTGGSRHVTIPEKQTIPTPTLTSYDPIKAADYQMTDPIAFAKRYGKFTRSQIKQNFDQSQQMGLTQLDTELQGLKNYVPAASALKRSETSLDNQFNQAQRTAQIRATSPESETFLKDQAGRAATYASGKLPSALEDRALEVANRSRSADNTAAAGFGANSMAANKVSDLMSAQERLQLSQYGDQLGASNINQQMAVLMAPTAYSTAGADVKVMPEVGAGRAAAAYTSELNQFSVIPASTAMANEINQQQFATNLSQRTKEYNATNKFQESINNAGIENQFKLTDFQYQTGYAAAVAGATNAADTMAYEDYWRQIYGINYNAAKSDTQSANTAGATTAAVVGGTTALANLIAAANGTGSTSGGGTTGGSNSTSGSQTPSDNTGITNPADEGFNSTTRNPVDVGSTSGTDSGGGNSSSNDISNPASEGFSYTKSATSQESGAVSQTNPTVSNFQADTGVDLGLNQSQTTALLSSSTNTINAAGLTFDARRDSQSIGTDLSGRQMYASRGALANQDTNAGKTFVTGLTNVLDPMGALTKEDASVLDYVGSAASDVAFLGSLDIAAQNKDTKGFVNLMMGKLKQGTLSTMDPNSDNYRGADTAFTAYQLLGNWNKMSGGQKSVAIASLGLKVASFSEGKNLAQIEIPATNVAGTKPLNVGQALSLMAYGVNTVALIKDWDQLTDVQRVVYGTGQIADTVRLAKDLGYMAKDVAPTATKEVVAGLGYQAAPNLGVGAQVAAPGAAVPEGYSITGNLGGKQVIAPTVTAQTSTGAISSQSGATPGYSYNPYVQSAPTVPNSSPVGGTGEPQPNMSVDPNATPAATGPDAADVAGAGAQIAGGAYMTYAGVNQYKEGDKVGGGINTAAGVSTAAQGASTLGVGGSTTAAVGAYSGPLMMAAGAHQVYKNWGQGENKGQAAMTGAAAGLMMAAGSVAAIGGPVGWVVGAVLFVAAVACSQIKTGKEQDQNYRDGVREQWQKNGFTDATGTLTLADGSPVSIGDDGHSGEHDPKDPTQIDTSGNSTGKLHSYEVDYTNNLDLASSMGGIALSRLMAGGKAKNIDQMGGQLGNVALGKVGYGADMNEANFSQVMANQRSMWAKAGISSAADGKQLANQAYSEGRINDFDLLQAHQSIDMIFSDRKDNYENAQRLLAGSKQGMRAAQDKAQSIDADLAKGKKDPTTTVSYGGNKPLHETFSPRETPSVFQGETSSSPTTGTFSGGKPSNETFTPQETPNMFQGEPITPTNISNLRSTTGLNAYNINNATPYGSAKSYGQQASSRGKLALSKEEVAARNQQMYGA